MKYPTKTISPHYEIVAITVVSSSIIGTLPNLQKCHLAHWSDYNDELYLALSSTGFRVSIKDSYNDWFESFILVNLISIIYTKYTNCPAQSSN